MVTIVHVKSVQEILAFIDSVNRRQIEKMEQTGKELDPSAHGSDATFSEQVRNVQAAIIHTYQLVASASLQQESPEEAARLWKAMSVFCDAALASLGKLKDIYPDCGTPELYDLALDYKLQADKRFYQNLEDTECAKTEIPKGLFPTPS
jgi:hypothetical protein